MRRQIIRNAFTAAAAAVVLIYASGCATTQTQKEAKIAAKQRWAQARANITFSMAQQQYEVGEIDKAEKTVNEAIAMVPNRPDYFDLAAKIFMERGQLERAFNTTKHSIELDDKRPQSHYLMGMIFQRWQQYDSAYKEYKLSYEAKADDPVPLMAMTEMLVKLNRADEAIKVLNDKLEYFAHNPGIRVSLGRIYLLTQHDEKAVDTLREASLLAPGDKEILEELTTAQYAAGHFPDAIDNLNTLLADKDYADRADLQSELGDCYMATQRPVEARRIYLKITHDHPNDANAWIKLANAAWVVEDMVRLGEATRQVLALAPQRYEGYLLRGMIQMHDGQNAQALPWFDRAASLAADNVSPLIMKGMALEKMGRKSDAVAVYHKALKISPNDKRVQRLLASVSQ